ncbi:hypothetical protein, variant [Salpingoeca rosetta]|uniref:Uncharacterized protein n=1 Tax=Salpingoeca rosetta (strain ATCC 50818 / BSB-021) TaxID=946362 RepID=F2U8W0_SALR5|nr:hypothetical protein, variant [Salpingoeca rosetta]EGD73163.1 hypothetical protein, variant [Salpingoeca rosetta]|eukprot:XP_004994194.1 hypothetical protein, variant [Salpingoeca rosetta]
MSLFRPEPAQGAGQGQQGQRKWSAPGAPANSPIAFRAGRMKIEGNRVTPLEAKGVLYLAKDDTNLPVLCWKNRTTGVVEDEIIVLPGNQKFYKCKSAPEGSRVYYLKMSDERHFFWMQEPNADLDKDRAERLNTIMSDENLVTGSLEDFADNSGGNGGNSQANAMMQLLSGGLPGMGGNNGGMNIPPELLQQMMGLQAPPQARQSSSQQQRTQQQQQQQGSTSSPAPPTTRAAEPETPPADTTQQQQQGGEGSQSEGQQQHGDLATEGLIRGLAAEMEQQGMGEGASLTDILAPENVEILLADDEVVARLLPFLPNAETATREDILNNIRSPQYIQSLQTFTSALQSGEDAGDDDGNDSNDDNDNDDNAMDSTQD